MDYSTDLWLNRMYEAQLKKTQKLADVGSDELDGLIASKKARLREVIGLNRLDEFENDNPPMQPSWQVVETREADGFQLDEMAVAVSPGLVTPVYILTPARYERTFVYCHGHGRGAEEAVDERYASEYQHCLPVTLARAGYRVIVPELVGFNRVVMRGYNEEAYCGCYANATQLLLFGSSMTAMRVKQILQAVDYAKQNDTVPPVVGGISGGGLVTAYAAALCDGLAGAFISCYANTFHGSIMPLFHCVDNFVPDIFSVGEEPEIIALACPTPLLISAGDEDPIFPVTHTREAVAYVKEIYARKNADTRVSVEIFNGAHQISEAALLPWLERL